MRNPWDGGSVLLPASSADLQDRAAMNVTLRVCWLFREKGNLLIHQERERKILELLTAGGGT